MESINHLSLNSSENFRIWQAGKLGVPFIKPFFFSLFVSTLHSTMPRYVYIYIYIYNYHHERQKSEHFHRAFKSSCDVFSIFTWRLILFRKLFFLYFEENLMGILLKIRTFCNALLFSGYIYIKDMQYTIFTKMYLLYTFLFYTCRELDETTDSTPVSVLEVHEAGGN